MAPDASSQPFPPFLIEPRFVPRVWGYSDLHPWYDCVAASEPIGEVWLTGDECRVANQQHVAPVEQTGCGDMPRERNVDARKLRR